LSSVQFEKSSPSSPSSIFSYTSWHQILAGKIVSLVFNMQWRFDKLEHEDVHVYVVLLAYMMVFVKFKLLFYLWRSSILIVQFSANTTSDKWLWMIFIASTRFLTIHQVHVFQVLSRTTYSVICLFIYLCFHISTRLVNLLNSCSLCLYILRVIKEKNLHFYVNLPFLCVYLSISAKLDGQVIYIIHLNLITIANLVKLESQNICDLTFPSSSPLEKSNINRLFWNLTLVMLDVIWNQIHCSNCIFDRLILLIWQRCNLSCLILNYWLCNGVTIVNLDHVMLSNQHLKYLIICANYILNLPSKGSENWNTQTSQN